MSVEDFFTRQVQTGRPNTWKEYIKTHFCFDMPNSVCPNHCTPFAWRACNAMGSDGVWYAIAHEQHFDGGMWVMLLPTPDLNGQPEHEHWSEVTEHGFADDDDAVKWLNQINQQFNTEFTLDMLGL